MSILHPLKGYHQHHQQNSVYSVEFYNNQVGFSHISSSQHKSYSSHAYPPYRPRFRFPKYIFFFSNIIVYPECTGRLPWMAPKLLNGTSSRVSDKVDAFSFGIAMREILTEKEPYVDIHCGAIIGNQVGSWQLMKQIHGW